MIGAVVLFVGVALGAAGLALQQPVGVAGLGLALSFVAFDRWLVAWRRESAALEDAAKAVIALTDRLVKLEGEVATSKLSEFMKR